MAKILVTGSMGIVGRHLVQALRTKGHDVTGCDVMHSHEPNYLRCNIAEFRQLERVLKTQRFAFVYNLAAEFGRWNGEDYYEGLWLTNVVGLKHLLRLQEELGFRLCHASSSEVYGEYDGEMTEDVMDKHEIKQLNDYAMTKWVNEQQILNSERMHKTQTVRFRIFNTYGPGEYYSPYRSVVCRFVYSALHNLPYTVYRHHTRTHTYITDAAQWIAAICDNFKAGEVYNIAGSHRTDIKTLSDTILKILKKDDALVTYKDAEPMTTKDKVASNAKMLRDLGRLDETSIEEGIRQTIAWMRQVYSSP